MATFLPSVLAMMTAREFFEAKLQFETDVADVAAALAGGAANFVLVDSRSDAAWRQGHLPGATHMPTTLIDDLLETLDRAVPIVTYCWGPGCNGATRSAAAFAARGFQVREMLGGFEYWAREGFEVHTSDGVLSRPADPLTAPVPSVGSAASVGSVASVGSGSAGLGPVGSGSAGLAAAGGTVGCGC